MTASDVLDFTEEEKTAIEELKKRLQEDIDAKSSKDTYMFYRFLKARDFDIKAAEDMLRKTIQWRKQNKVDALLTHYEPPEVMKNFLAKTVMCVDREGSVVHYFPAGKWDARGLCMSAKYADLELASLQFLETDFKYMREHGKGDGYFPGLVFVYDMDGLTFAKATYKRALEYSIRFVKIIQDHYPECLKSLVFINASVYFTFIFNFMKPFLAQSIINKIQVFSKDGFQEELLRAIDEKDLPAFLGGERTDPDGNPLCLTIFNQGGPIPEKFHIHKSKKSLCGGGEGVKKLTLPRASFSEVAVAVAEAGSVVEWEFETKNRDIGFGLFYRSRVEEEEDGEVTELVPLLRLETDNFSETGVYKCDKPGTYVMLFDNSYSWIRSKEIYYRTRVITPHEHGAQMEKP